MDTNGVTLGRLAGVGLGGYIALAGLATLVGMPWQYTGGAALAALRVLGSVITVLGGAALVWVVATGGANANAGGARERQ